MYVCIDKETFRNFLGISETLSITSRQVMYAIVVVVVLNIDSHVCMRKAKIDKFAYLENRKNSL